MHKKNNSRLVKTLTYSAIAIALATVLSYIKILNMPQGGAITLFSMMFITLIGYWFGVIPGIIAGVSYGLLQLVLDPFIVHPSQVLLDYPLAFGALGLSGLFCNKENGLLNGYIIGVFGRLLFTSLSGYIFFGQFAPEGFNPIAYTIAYNIAYIGGEAFLTVLLMMAPPVKKAISTVHRSQA